jgi:FlaA1/EpsC-like NDP-sugar epimerase
MESKIPVVVIGSGGHAKVVIDILELMGTYEVVGVTSKDSGLGSSFFGYPVLGTDDVLPGLMEKGINHAAIGIGGLKDNRLRKKIFEKIKSLGFEMVTAVHPSVIISPSVKIRHFCRRGD